MAKKKVVITGGHLTPAMAVIEELIREKNWQIIFIGRKHAAEGDPALSVEQEVISQLEIPFYPLIAGRVQRRISRWTIVSLLKIPLGFIQAFMYLWRFKPQLVLSFGGYLSSPVVFAAWLLGIPVLTHEQTTVKGLATRFNALFAQKIAVSWPISVSQFPKNKVVLTGNPIRKEILKTDESIWRALNFEKDLSLILITGGNQGGHVINKIVEESLSILTEKANLFHQCGHLEAWKDFDQLSQKRERLPTKLKGRYHVKKYLNAVEMGTLLNKADLVVTRAGANIITELAVLGKPCLLIPLSWIYRSEQQSNAEMLAKIGLGEILLENELSASRFNQLVFKMLNQLNYYQKNAKKAQEMVKRGAVDKIIALIKELSK